MTHPILIFDDSLVERSYGKRFEGWSEVMVEVSFYAGFCFLGFLYYLKKLSSGCHYEQHGKLLGQKI